MLALRIRLGHRSYDFLVGGGLLGRAGRLIRRRFGKRRIFVVTSHPLRERFGRILGKSLRIGGLTGSFMEVPDGERAKDWRTAGKLLRALARGGASRDALVVAFGGGTVGDLAGFAAATYARGMEFVQIPTTLLAQVDSSVGGKTGVDLPEGKNLAGAFHQPSLVIADTDLLCSLPSRQLRAGMAEVIKHGIIKSAAFFRWLERNADNLLAREPRALAHAISACVRIKAGIVSADEREAGRRALLNFGHTAGHAIEAVLGYRGLMHGEAVAIGMVCAARLSVAMRLCSRRIPERIEELLGRFGLPVRPPKFNGRRLVKALLADKKRLGGRMRLVMVRQIGDVTIKGGIRPEAILKALSECRRAGPHSARL